MYPDPDMTTSLFWIRSEFVFRLDLEYRQSCQNRHFFRKLREETLRRYVGEVSFGEIQNGRKKNKICEHISRSRDGFLHSICTG